MECRACGFAHLYPLPSESKLDEFYRRAFYWRAKPGYVRKTIRELDYWKITYGDRLEIFDTYLRRKKRRILDIGCSSGHFLKYFKEKGWETLGIEPSRDAARYTRAQGVDVIERPFQAIPVAEMGKFDAVNMAFVLEHTLDPARICKKCFTLLRKGGIAAVETPNDFNPFQRAVKRRFRKESYWIAYPDHVNYFNPDSLERLMKRAGFRLLVKEGTFPMELFLLMGDDYVGDARVGARCHKKRMEFEKNLSRVGGNTLKRSLYRALLSLGIGRESILYFVKG